MATKYINKDWTDNKNLVIEHNALTGKINISYDGVHLDKQAKKQYSAEVDGKIVTALVEGNEVSGLFVVIFGNRIQLVQPMAWYEWLVAALIVAPCICFGAVGGVLGVLSSALCVVVMRKINNVALKILAGIALGGVCVYLVMIMATVIGVALFGTVQ